MDYKLKTVWSVKFIVQAGEAQWVNVRIINERPQMQVHILFEVNLSSDT